MNLASMTFFFCKPTQHHLQHHLQDDLTEDQLLMQAFAEPLEMHQIEALSNELLGKKEQTEQKIHLYAKTYFARQPEIDDAKCPRKSQGNPKKTPPFLLI
ncbi:MAG: hypothetical protein K0S07_891 [Chlamydiales bacterium]|jgi:hypothetical protein|nr:hypothetical protein [Chlamydiales bacterium]